MEMDIERDGFRFRPNHYTSSEVGAIVDTFERLRFNGEHPGGFSVLTAFTQADFSQGPDADCKPVFFAESAFRGVLYAGREWAGGETARALRFALADLEKYLRDSTYRQAKVRQAWEDLRDFYRGEVPAECIPADVENTRFEHVHLLWLHLARSGFPIGMAGRAGVPPVHFSERWLEERLQSLSGVWA